jgi:hypothetical protein
MKKLSLSLLSLLLVTSSFAQIHLRVSVGYNLPAASEQLGVSTNYKYEQTGPTTTSKGVYGSFGSGFVAHVAFGGAFKSGLLGYDIDFGYVKGKTYEVLDVNDYGGGYVNTSTSRAQSTSIQISPALTFTTGTGSFQPFARLGPTIAISKVTSENTDYDANYDYTEVQEFEFTGGINIGLKGVVGCSYQLNDMIQVYVEADFVSLAYAPKKRTMTRNDQNGVDNLPTTDPKVVTVEFEKEETVTNQYGTPEVRPTFPMSSIGFQGGIKFIF